MDIDATSAILEINRPRLVRRTPRKALFFNGFCAICIDVRDVGIAYVVIGSLAFTTGSSTPGIVFEHLF
jgi:hypothetical protein